MLNKDANTCDLEKQLKKYPNVVFFPDAVNNFYKNILFYSLPFAWLRGS